MTEGTHRGQSSLRTEILNALRISGTATQIAARVGRSFTSVTGALKELQKAGLVYRLPKGRSYIYHR